MLPLITIVAVGMGEDVVATIGLSPVEVLSVWDAPPVWGAICTDVPSGWDGMRHLRMGCDVPPPETLVHPRSTMGRASLWIRHHAWADVDDALAKLPCRCHRSAAVVEIQGGGGLPGRCGHHRGWGRGRGAAAALPYMHQPLQFFLECQ